MLRSGLFFLLTLLASCDCNQVVSGVVVDKGSGKPLYGVTVVNKIKTWNKTTTDSSGHFELSAISGVFVCPPMTILVQNDSFKTLEVEIPAGGKQNIELEAVTY